MKRLFLLNVIAILAVLGISAQNVTKKATFSFSHPETLHPSLSVEGVPAVSVVGKVFSDGPVSVEILQNGGLIPSIQKKSDNTPFLCIYRFNVIAVKTNGAKIKKISFGEFDITSGITPSDNLGTFEYDVWEALPNLEVAEVQMENKQQLDAMLSEINVEYETPMDILQPTSVYPANGTTLYTTDFNGVTFSFDSEISTTKSESFKFEKSGTTEYISAVATASGKTVTVTPTNALSAGEYTLSADKEAIKTSEGFYNPEMTTVFTLHNPQNTFMPTVLPDGEVESVPADIELEFPGVIGNYGIEGDDEDLSKKKFDIVNIVTGQKVASASCSLKDGKTNVLLLSLAPHVALTQNGVYTLTIPAKTVYNVNYKAGYDGGEEWNDAISLEFRVGNVYIPSAAIVEKANAALSLTGLGYPKADAAERVALQNALNDALNNYNGSEEEMNNLINAFYASTDVVMPENGNYYTVANLMKNGTKSYLKYSDGAVTLTTAKDEAAHFLVTKTAQGKYVFSVNGAYLHTLMPVDLYIGTSSKNVLPEYNAEVNDITVARLVVTDVDNTETIGKFSLYGAIGRFEEGTEMLYAYSLVKNGVINVPNTKNWYTDQTSTAFVFEETTQPDPETVYSVSPVSGSTLTSVSDITVTIEGVTGLAQNAAKDIYFGGNTVNSVSVERNVITLTPYFESDGSYTLLIPKGAFTYQYEGRTIDVPQITATYNVVMSDKFSYDFTAHYGVHSSMVDEGTHHPLDFNNFYIYYNSISAEEETGFAINPQVNLCKLHDYNTGVIVAEGTFRAESSKQWVRTDKVLCRKKDTGEYAEVGVIVNELSSTLYVVRHDDGSQKRYTYNANTDKIENRDYYEYTHKLYYVFPEKFTEENLKDSRYGFIAVRGSFGDENFGRYLDNPSSVLRSDCHLIEQMGLYYNSSKNATPAGIENVEVMTESDVLYDLTGRKVGSTNVPGIYIKNGKKIIVR